jgi:hypothetical protein
MLQPYRAFVTAPGGRVLLAIDLYCTDESAAKQRAQALDVGHDIELWYDGHKVAVFEKRH